MTIKIKKEIIKAQELKVGDMFLWDYGTNQRINRVIIEPFWLWDKEKLQFTNDILYEVSMTNMNIIINENLIIEFDKNAAKQTTNISKFKEVVKLTFEELPEQINYIVE